MLSAIEMIGAVAPSFEGLMELAATSTPNGSLTLAN